MENILKKLIFKNFFYTEEQGLRLKLKNISDKFNIDYNLLISKYIPEVDEHST